MYSYFLKFNYPVLLHEDSTRQSPKKFRSSEKNFHLVKKTIHFNSNSRGSTDDRPISTKCPVFSRSKRFKTPKKHVLHLSTRILQLTTFICDCRSRTTISRSRLRKNQKIAGAPKFEPLYTGIPSPPHRNHGKSIAKQGLINAAKRFLNGRFHKKSRERSTPKTQHRAG